MRTFRRLYQPGGTYFFTVVTANRWPCFDNADNVRLLGDALQCTRSSHPFDSLAIVVMPDHLHCLWKLMPDDADFSLRWQLVKKRFTANLSAASPHTSRRTIWQPRFWEHLIRDAEDFGRHLDYLHYNPVKHGLAATPSAWPYSTFKRYVRTGVYAPDWAADSANRLRNT
jgi:putative transposase